MLANVFNNFQNIFLEIYGLEREHCLSAWGLALQASLKKTKVKLDLLTDIDMFLMVEKGVGYVIPFIHSRKLATNTWKFFIKTESSYIKYWDINKQYGREMLQKLSVDDFNWVERNLQWG